MSGALNVMLARNTSSGSHLDTQTVETGSVGTAPLLNRVRGWSTGVIGVITDGTSNVYAGAAITSLYYDENGSGGAQFYCLAITGAANSGWTTLTIGSTVLSRASATFSSGTWTWSTTDTVATQAFGASGSIHSCYFD